jgi:hypothetical protein
MDWDGGHTTPAKTSLTSVQTALKPLFRDDNDFVLAARTFEKSVRNSLETRQLIKIVDDELNDDRISLHLTTWVSGDTSETVDPSSMSPKLRSGLTQLCEGGILSAHDSFDAEADSRVLASVGILVCSILLSNIPRDIESQYTRVKDDIERLPSSKTGAFLPLLHFIGAIVEKETHKQATKRGLRFS